jgi:hypothetical protein
MPIWALFADNGTLIDYSFSEEYPSPDELSSHNAVTAVALTETDVKELEPHLKHYVPLTPLDHLPDLDTCEWYSPADAKPEQLSKHWKYTISQNYPTCSNPAVPSKVCVFNQHEANLMCPEWRADPVEVLEAVIANGVVYKLERSRFNNGVLRYAMRQYSDNEFGEFSQVQWSANGISDQAALEQFHKALDDMGVNWHPHTVPAPQKVSFLARLMS